MRVAVSRRLARRHRAQLEQGGCSSPTGRLAGVDHHLHGLRLELRAESPTMLWIELILSAENHRPRCRRLTRKRSTPAIRPRNEPPRRAGLDSAGGKAFSIGMTRCCCRGSASAMAPAGACGLGRLGSRTPVGGGQWPPRLPKRPKPRPPRPPELMPPTWSMAHLSATVPSTRSRPASR